VTCPRFVVFIIAYEKGFIISILFYKAEEDKIEKDIRKMGLIFLILFSKFL